MRDSATSMVMPTKARKIPTTSPSFDFMRS
jgi:hypothetical protein